MPGQAGKTGHDDVVAEDAIMRDMRVDDEQVVRADHRGVAVVRRAMNGHAFAKNIVVANFQARDAALVFQVLRLHADGGERENLIPPPQPGVAVHDHMRMQFAFVAQRDVFADDAIRADLATGADLRLGMNNGSGMNHGNFDYD